MHSNIVRCQRNAVCGLCVSQTPLSGPKRSLNRVDACSLIASWDQIGGLT